jgi:hypothetical protein
MNEQEFQAGLEEIRAAARGIGEAVAGQAGSPWYA